MPATFAARARERTSDPTLLRLEAQVRALHEAARRYRQEARDLRLLVNAYRRRGHDGPGWEAARPRLVALGLLPE